MPARQGSGPAAAPAATAWLTPELLNRLEVLRLAVRSVRAGRRIGGRFPINRRGSSIEFADYAPYYAGDDIRTIDWNLYARLDRLFVKTYKEEIELTVEILIDATRSMALPSPEKFMRAARLAVCLGYVAVAGGHHVRLTWIGPGVLRTTPWFHRRRDAVRMAALAEAARPEGQVDLAAWMQRAIPALRLHGGQALLLTDGMVRPAEFFRALHLLMVRNLEVRVIQVLTPQELHPAALTRGGRLVDAETGATHQLGYTPAELDRAVTEHNEQLVRYCKQHGVPFARHVTDQSLESFIATTLPQRGILE